MFTVNLQALHGGDIIKEVPTNDVVGFTQGAFNARPELFNVMVSLNGVWIGNLDRNPEANSCPVCPYLSDISCPI